MYDDYYAEFLSSLNKTPEKEITELRKELSKLSEDKELPSYQVLTSASEVTGSRKMSSSYSSVKDTGVSLPVPTTSSSFNKSGYLQPGTCSTSDIFSKFKSPHHPPSHLTHTTSRSSEPIQPCHQPSTFADSRKNSVSNTDAAAVVTPEQHALIEDDAGKKDERDAVYAQHYFTNVKQMLSDDAERFKKFLTILHDVNRNHMNPVELCGDMAIMLSRHQDLVDDFAGFLLSFQAVECNCFVSNLEYQQLLTFLKKLEIFCDNSPNVNYQPSLKMMSRWFIILNQEAQSDPIPFKEKIAAVLQHVPNVMDDLQSYFFGTPLPDSHPDHFEEVNLDEEAMKDVDEENEGQEDYNTKLGSCQCHQDQQDEKLCRRIKHCYSCSLKDTIRVNTQKQETSDLKSACSKPRDYQYKTTIGKLTEIVADVSGSSSAAKNSTGAENCGTQLTSSATNNCGIVVISEVPAETAVISVSENKLDSDSSTPKHDDVDKSGMTNVEPHLNANLFNSGLAPVSTSTNKMIDSSNLGSKDFTLQSCMASSSSGTVAEPLLTFSGALEKLRTSSDKPVLTAPDTVYESQNISTPVTMENLPRQTLDVTGQHSRPDFEHAMSDDGQSYSAKEMEDDLQYLCPQLNPSQMLLDDKPSNSFVLSEWTEEQDRSILNVAIARGVTQETVRKLHSKMPAKSVEEINSRARYLLQMLEQMSDTDTDTSHSDPSEQAE